MWPSWTGSGSMRRKDWTRANWLVVGIEAEPAPEAQPVVVERSLSWNSLTVPLDGHLQRELRVVVWAGELCVRGSGRRAGRHMLACDCLPLWCLSPRTRLLRSLSLIGLCTVGAGLCKWLDDVVIASIWSSMVVLLEG